MSTSGRRGPGRLFALVAFVGLIGYIDYVTGPSISLTLLYLLPVAAAGWVFGQRQGIAVAVIAGLVSLVDVLVGNGSTSVAVAWNAVSRTFVLGLAAFAADSIHRDRDRLLLQDVQRRRSLELLDRGLATPARHLVDLSVHWDGSAEELKKLVRRSADEMMFLARDFSAVIRLQGGDLALEVETFDFVELVNELRREQPGQILMTAPESGVAVRGDRARTRQVLSDLIASGASGDDVSLLVDRRGDKGRLVVSSRNYRRTSGGIEDAKDDLGLSAELAQLLFLAQRGSVELDRNPVAGTLRITAQLPAA